MEIIKDAFVEGRDTKTVWDKSTAKDNQLKLDVALENLSLMKKKETYAPIPLHQVDPHTGKVLNTFPSRLAAARYIVKEVLKRPEKNPLAVTGNIEMCMRSGWKSYGFYWKLATTASIEKYTTPSGTAKRIYATSSGKGGVFTSIREAADTLGVSAKIISRRAKGQQSSKKDRLFVQPYNATLRTVQFKNLSEAAKAVNVHPATMTRWVKNGKPINNTIYIVENFKELKVTRQYTIYQGNKNIGTYRSAKEVAIVMGSSRSKVVRAIKNNSTLGEFGQYKVKVVNV